MVDLHHLRLFVRASELSSFSKAAITLGLAQPTVSRLMKELEGMWGGQLFYRTGRGVVLSELGEIALGRARVLLEEASKLSEDLRTYSLLPSGVVSLGLPPSLVPAIVPELVNQLRRDAPGILLRIHEGFSDHVERWLSAGEVEVGVYGKCHEGDAVSDDSLFASYMVLAAPRSAPPLPPEVEFADLAKYPLVLPAIPNGIRVMFEGISRRQRISLGVVVETNSILTQKLVCEHCGSYMINAQQTFREEIAQGLYTMSRIVNPRIQRHVVLLTTQQRPLSRAAREVANRVTAILTQFRIDSEAGTLKETQPAVGDG